MLAFSTISVAGLPHRSKAPQIESSNVTPAKQKTSIVIVKSPCHS
jgi:hypothetical protein